MCTTIVVVIWLFWLCEVALGGHCTLPQQQPPRHLGIGLLVNEMDSMQIDLRCLHFIAGGCTVVAWGKKAAFVQARSKVKLLTSPRRTTCLHGNYFAYGRVVNNIRIIRTALVVDRAMGDELPEISTRRSDAGMFVLCWVGSGTAVPNLLTFPHNVRGTRHIQYA